MLSGTSVPPLMVITYFASDRKTSALPSKADVQGTYDGVLLPFEKPTHDRGSDHAAAHSIGAA
jgi:hypothetical protein